MSKFLVLLSGFALLTGCPQPVDNGSSGPAPTTASPTPQAGGPTPPPVEGGAMPPLPGGEPPIPADQLQREIGALSETGQAVKVAFEAYVNANSSGGWLTVDDGMGGSIQGKYQRTHDPIRIKKGQGYVALADFQSKDMPDGVLHSVGYWAKEGSYEIFDVTVQAHPEKKGGEWVRMDHYRVDDTIADPVR